MSHVDEGTLHAYLDGALDAMPSVDGAWVRAHLASCDLCAARLEEERSIREQAGGLLADAAPHAAEPPPFEEVLVQARARRRADSTSRVQRLAWAASIVLAVGAGWMLRSASVPELVQERAFESVAVPASDPATAQPEPPGALADAAASPTTGRAHEEEPASASEVPAGKSAGGGGTRLADVPAPAPREPAEVKAVELPAPPTTLELERLADTLGFPRTATEAREAIAAAARVPPAGLQRVAAPSPGTEALVSSREAAADREKASVRGAQLELAAARRSEPARSRGSLAVPGLEVLSVESLDDEGLGGAVRVRQLLAEGDTLEVVHLPGGLTPSLLEPVRVGHTELVLPRGEGWLVVRGAAGRDALLELVRRMEEG